MKVIGHSLNHTYSRQASTFLPESELIHQTDVECNANFRISKAFLAYHGEEACYRPYFLLIGRLENVRAQFPEGITEVEYEDSDTPEVQVNYELDNEQLGNMYRKGVFPNLDQLQEFLSRRNDRLGVRPETVVTPSIMNDNRYDDIPVKCSVLVIKRQSQNDAPIIFVQPEKPFDIVITKETSGYDLVDYMEPFEQDELNIEDRSYAKLDEDIKYFEPQKEEEPVEVIEKSEDEKMVDKIFGVTKPRVDKHIEDDKELLARANEAAEAVENENTSYESTFEQLMLEESDEPAAKEASAKTEETRRGPLSMDEIMSRQQKAQSLADKVKESDEDEIQSSKE